MELTARKQKILATIVKTYISAGEPVGSKVLCESLGNVSSATVRNDMSDLAMMGYLDQPHTSAGRIPTEKGLRFYIDHLMGEGTLTAEDKRRIDSMLPASVDDFDRAMQSAAAAIAELTRCAAILTTEADKSTEIYKIELIPMGRYTALLVLVTSTGLVRSRMYRFSTELTSDTVELFMNLVRSELVGSELCSFQPAAVQSLAVSAGEHALLLTPLISAIASLISEASEAQLKLQGESNLLSYSDISQNKAKQIFDLMSHRDTLLSLLSRTPEGVGVILGGDTRFDALDASSLVVARYMLGGLHSGYIGVIGPTRMDYDRIIPSIGYFAHSLSRLLSDNLEDMKG